MKLRILVAALAAVPLLAAAQAAKDAKKDAPKASAPATGNIATVNGVAVPRARAEFLMQQQQARGAQDNEQTRNMICSPVSEFRTRLPGWLVKLLLNPVATRIFEQDRSILKSQAEALRRWKGEHYASTPIDVLGLQIARLLKGGDPGEDWSREIEMDV